ncbi:MAG: glycosyltransferase, partial [Acidobacteriota bacterium]
ALAAGIDLAEGEIIILLDADGQNDPADIPHLVEKLEQGFDVVSGWRRARKDVLVSRRVPSMLANWLISKFTGVRLHDCGCTLKAYRASLLRELRLYGDMHRFIPVFLAQLGARITEMEVNHRPRRGGVSKYGGERILKVLADLVLIFFMARFYTRPMHFFGKLGALFFFAATLTGFGMLCFKFGWLRWIGIDYTATFVETPLPALMATFVIGSANSFFFGILGEVLMRIHHESTGQLGYAVHKVDDSEEAAA